MLAAKKILLQLPVLWRIRMLAKRVQDSIVFDIDGPLSNRSIGAYLRI